MSTEIPTADGNYVDSGGYLWSLDEGRWTFHGQGDEVQPREPVEKFAPFTRLIPEHPVHGILGDQYHGHPYEVVIPCSSLEEANTEKADLHVAAEARAFIRATETGGA